MCIRDSYKEALERKETDEKVEEERRRTAIEKQKIAEQAEERRKEATYQEAVKLQASKKYGQAHAEFERLRDYKDSKDRANNCLRSEKKRRTIFSFVMSVLILFILLSLGLIIVYQTVILPEEKYQKAESLLQKGNYDGAKVVFAELSEYKDSADRVSEICYLKAEKSLEQQDYYVAAINFAQAGAYQDAKERSLELWDCLVAVSYTHLDVYKRQPVWFFETEIHTWLCDSSFLRIAFCI